MSARLHTAKWQVSAVTALTPRRAHHGGVTAERYRAVGLLSCQRRRCDNGMTIRPVVARVARGRRGNEMGGVAEGGEVTQQEAATPPSATHHHHAPDNPPTTLDRNPPRPGALEIVPDATTDRHDRWSRSVRSSRAGPTREFAGSRARDSSEPLSEVVHSTGPLGRRRNRFRHGRDAQVRTGPSGVLRRNTGRAG